MAFSERNITVTLTGAQWFALLARIGGRELSAKGAREYREATERLQKQLLAQKSDPPQ